MAINSDGLFGKAKEATTKWNISVKEEQDAIENILLQANEISGGATKQGSIELNKTSLTLEIVDGANIEETLVATLKNIEGEVNWTSTDLAVATVDESGKVTTVGAGEATITASYSRYSASCKVTVVEKTTPKVTLSANTGEVEAESTLVLTASLNVTAEENIVWTSSDTSIATVSGSGTNNSTGTITGVSAGIATITATYKEKTSTCTVTVKEKVTLISFDIDGKTYYAEESMYWDDWIASAYNTGGFQIKNSAITRNEFLLVYIGRCSAILLSHGRTSVYLYGDDRRGVYHCSLNIIVDRPFETTKNMVCKLSTSYFFDIKPPSSNL